MTKDPPASLTDLVTELAVSAAAVQATLDLDRITTLQQLSVGDARMLEILGLGSVIAPLLRVSEFRVATSVSVRLSTDKELVIAARPINLGFRLTHRSQHRTESRIEICVDRVPVPGAYPAPKVNAAGAAVTPTEQGGKSE